MKEFNKNSLLLYGVTDRAWVGESSIYAQVEDAIKGGITCLQLREKNLSDEQFLQEALTINQLCKKHHIPFFVNDNVNVAIKSGASGIHVGQKDMAVADVKALIGENMILGVSAQSVEQAKFAEKCGADYLGVGAMFTTSTKQDAEIVSFETLNQICSAVSIPVVSIGGISKHNISKLSSSGIAGVALVSAIFASDNIIDECQKLFTLTKKVVRP